MKKLCVLLIMAAAMFNGVVPAGAQVGDPGVLLSLTSLDSLAIGAPGRVSAG